MGSGEGGQRADRRPRGGGTASGAANPHRPELNLKTAKALGLWLQESLLLRDNGVAR